LLKSRTGKTFIIAEAGVNHNGSIEIAGKLIDAAAEAGADAVKFQTFKAEHIVTPHAGKADYQREATCVNESQLEMLKRLELDGEAHVVLMDHCKDRGIEFISSPFDLQSIDVLNDLGIRTLKIPSGEITNLPYLRKIGSTGKEIILSTGMSNLNEIKDALDILMGQGIPKEAITVLQCCTQYPAPFEDVNLRAMKTMGDTFGVAVGYSDHTSGIEAAIAAVALGATVVEKHFTLDKSMDGPDHQASADIPELKALVSSVRNVERALGNGIKQAAPSELSNREVVRKVIVAARAISNGEEFTDENITVKRAGRGVSPMQWDCFIGRQARRAFMQDEPIEL
jgi:N,N'-diacetyllegionaminate synthase